MTGDDGTSIPVGKTWPYDYPGIMPDTTTCLRLPPTRIKHG